MAKQFLKPGRQFNLCSVVRVGATGTVVDLSTDWSATADYTGNNPETVGNGVGNFVDFEGDDALTYDVFVDLETGQLWYDDETGH